MLFNAFAINMEMPSETKDGFNEWYLSNSRQCSVCITPVDCRLKICSPKNALTGKMAQGVKMTVTKPGDSQTFSSDPYMYVWHAHYHIQHICTLNNKIKLSLLKE